MKSLTRGHTKAGIDSLRGAKWRNFWTMLGVIIGVMSVITVVGIGEGIKLQISGQIHHYAKDLITIRPEGLSGSGNADASNPGVFSSPAISGSLTLSDVKTVSETSGVDTAVPLSAFAPRSIVGANGAYKDGLVVGTLPELPNLINQSMAYGVFLTTDDEGVNAAVLGSHAAQKLFNEDVPLGSSFTINGQEFIVRGIFNQFDSTPLSQQVNFNNAIFIPYDVADSMSKSTAVTYEILAKPTSTAAASQRKVISSLQSRLANNHGGQNTISVLPQSQNVANSNSILELLTRLITGVAAISLLVGGIGIMNVMLVSVTERMHEIGIRKAIGATNRQILSQFIIEATVLSVSGGLIGIAVAYLIDLTLRLATNLRPSISWQLVVLATGVSLIVGIVFGTIPALKAARKDPIDALRSDY